MSAKEHDQIALLLALKPAAAQAERQAACKTLGTSGRSSSLANIILDIYKKAVSTPSDIRTALSEAESQGRRAVLMRVKSGDATVFIALPLKRS